MTRAKFKCVKVETTEEGSNVELQPVVSGSDENENFFKYTPYGNITLGIINLNVKFKEGSEYYVDFTEA